MFMHTVLRIMGTIRRRILVSSTCVTVHIRHELGMVEYGVPSGFVVMAARSKNLEWR